MAVKTFGTEVLSSSHVNTYLTNSGLVYISTTSLTRSSVSIAGCFSSTYDNYVVVINNLVTVASALNLVQFATGTTDSSANYGRQRFYAQQSTTGAVGSISETSGGIGYTVAGVPSAYTMEIYQPNLARKTSVKSQGVYGTGVYPYIEWHQIFLDTSTQYTGMVLTPSGTTFTSGTATIFGYRKA